MLCNFCGKTLDPCDEANLGDLTVRFFLWKQTRRRPDEVFHVL